MLEQLKQEIQDRIQPLLAQKSIEIVEYNIYQRGREGVIQVLIDKEKGGITVEECSVINKEILNLMEEKQLMDSDYSVEVSSPGVDRPLKTKKDFLRVSGRVVVFYLLENVEGKKEHQGTIQNVLEESVEINTKNGLVAIPLRIINKAVQII